MPKPGGFSAEAQTTPSTSPSSNSKPKIKSFANHSRLHIRPGAKGMSPKRGRLHCLQRKRLRVLYKDIPWQRGTTLATLRAGGDTLLPA